MQKLHKRLALGIAITLLLGGCAPSDRHLELSGNTMGTTWNVTLSAGSHDESSVRSGIQQRLDGVNQSMSTWLADSELSQLNRTPIGEWLPVSPELIVVLQAAQQLGDTSGGAFDATVGPLVALWGFGAGAATELPDESQIVALRPRVDYRLVEIRRSPSAARRLGDVSIDLSAIAKGFAVDLVATWLHENGHLDYLVEVGGEVRVAGLSPRQAPWRLGIERPDSLAREVAARIELTDRAVATSGDYRNYRRDKGVRRSHTIDPRTGHPVRHNVASVTVIDSTAMAADGWATALTVLGAQQGLAIAEQQSLAALFIIRTPDGFAMRATRTMEAFLGAASTD